MPARPVRAQAISLCVFLIVMVASCGLVRPVFLYPPRQESIETGVTDGITSFEHNTENLPQEIQGYEIYYKIYGPEQDDKIFTEEEAILDTDAEARPRLRNRGFQRLRWESEPRSVPLISIPFEERTNAVPVTVNFARVFEGEDAFVEWELVDSGETVRRYLVRTTAPGEHSAFTDSIDEYSANHDDVDDAIGEFNGVTRLQLVAYVLAYGIDPDELTAVYSFDARRLFDPAFDGFI